MDRTIKNFYRTIKNFYKMIRIHREVKVAEQNRRFNAPYLKSLAGKQMVFSAEQEQDLYFKNLTVNW